MKNLFLAVLLSVCALYASAEIRVQKLDNIKGTNITLVDDGAAKNYSVTDAVFVNDYKEYKAKKIRCNVVDGVATIKVTFKKCTLFRDCKVILTVNGKQETVEFNLR